MGADGRSLPGTWNPQLLPPNPSGECAFPLEKRGFLSFPPRLYLFLFLFFVRTVHACYNFIIKIRISVSRRRRRQPTLPLWEIVRHSVRSGKGKKNSSRKGCPPTICIAGQPRWKPLTRAPVNQPYLSLPSLLCEITIVARNPRNLRTLFRDLHRISVLFREIRDLGSVSAPASTWNVVENCGRCFKSVLPGRCPRSFVFKRVSRSRLRSYALLRACLYSWIANSKVKWLCIRSRKITWAITRSRRYRL